MTAAAILNFCTNNNNSATDWHKLTKFCTNVATNVLLLLQNFMNLFQSAADVLCFVLKYKIVAIAMSNFTFVRFYGITTCRTSNLALIWNFVQVRAIATKLWAINGIQNGDRHLEFIFLSILIPWSISVSSRRHYCKISLMYVNRRLSYCCLCKNPRWWPSPFRIFLLNILAY